jgi:hypothetical protein
MAQSVTANEKVLGEGNKRNRVEKKKKKCDGFVAR